MALQPKLNRITNEIKAIKDKINSLCLQKMELKLRAVPSNGKSLKEIEAQSAWVESPDSESSAQEFRRRYLLVTKDVGIEPFLTYAAGKDIILEDATQVTSEMQEFQNSMDLLNNQLSAEKKALEKKEKLLEDPNLVHLPQAIRNPQSYSFQRTDMPEDLANSFEIVNAYLARIQNVIKSLSN